MGLADVAGAAVTTSHFVRRLDRGRPSLEPSANALAPCLRHTSRDFNPSFWTEDRAPPTLFPRVRGPTVAPSWPRAGARGSSLVQLSLRACAYRAWGSNAQYRVLRIGITT